MTENLKHIVLTAPYTPPGSDVAIPAQTVGEPRHIAPENRPSCYTPGLRIGLSFYCTLSKSSKGVEKVGTVIGRSERGGGFPEERCSLIEVQWDGEERVGTVHPHNILRMPNHYTFSWNPPRQREGFLHCDMADVLKNAEFKELRRNYGATF